MKEKTKNNLIDSIMVLLTITALFLIFNMIEQCHN